jgi:hypothetical protein
MSIVKQKMSASELLDDIYKNVKMGADSIINLLSRVKDEGERVEMTRQLDGYERLAQKASRMMNEIGMKPKEESAMARASAKIGMSMNTMIDSSSSHIAEMMVQGSTMGVTDMLRKITEAQEQGIRGEVIALAREVADFEQHAAERMKAYL